MEGVVDDVQNNEKRDIIPSDGQDPKDSRKMRFRIVEELDVVSSINSLFKHFASLRGKVRQHDRELFNMKTDMGTKLELEGVSNQKADKTFVQKMLVRLSKGLV